MIRLVTDSTSYLPLEFIKQYNIAVVPLKIQFGHEAFDELMGINDRDLYHRLTNTSDFPTTSQPSAAEFERVYRQILEQDPPAEILVLTVSSQLSGTCNTAMMAAAELSDSAITVFDSLSAAMGVGLMVLAAARMAARGESLADILTRLVQMRQQISIFVMADTLEYLKRGGRIGAAAAFLGTLLDTKPILTVEDGLIQPLTRVRSKKKAIHRLLTELEQKLPVPDHPVQAGVMHVFAEDEALKLGEMIREKFNVTYFFIFELGPVIGAHLGPGGLGTGLCLDPT